MAYIRALHLPEPSQGTFFLWGPRQTGKTTLLRATYPNALWIDLLDTRVYRALVTAPWELVEMIHRSKPSIVVIDEIQKVPQLLDEVHRLHEAGVVFALCGSSARKVRRGHANLLGGRALRFELFGLVSCELGGEFDLTRLLNRGCLPRIYDADSPNDLLSSYTSDYLKEEIVSEGLIRDIAPFDDFLRQAALSDGEIVNASTIARECGVSRHSVGAYFQILEDTLLGRFLPAYVKRPKRRITKSPKFYFHDVGVVAQLAKRGRVEPGSELFGKAFENWIFHELTAYNLYRRRNADLSYWRLSTGVEVDFLVNGLELAIESKASERIRSDHLRNLEELKLEHPNVKRRLLVSLSPQARLTENGIEIVGAKEFAEMLWGGKLF